MKLIVGLGNPGPKYELTRHNAGFLLVDLVAEELGLSVEQEKFHSLFGKGSAHGEQLLFIKPMNYMNNSGVCVANFLHYYKLDSQDLLVIHDDVETARGKVKYRLGGGTAGHNGIRSIKEKLGTSEFGRLKIGLGRPQTRIDLASWVLQSFEDDELQSLQTEVLASTKERVQEFLTA